MPDDLQKVLDENPSLKEFSEEFRKQEAKKAQDPGKENSLHMNENSEAFKELGKLMKKDLRTPQLTPEQRAKEVLGHLIARANCTVDIFRTLEAHLDPEDKAKLVKRLVELSDEVSNTKYPE